MTSLNSLQSEEPFLSMLIEPENKVRFRYRSEPGKHGGVLGKRPTEKTSGKKSGEKKVFPTVKLNNYHGKQSVVIRVSLYTENKVKHLFELHGKNARADGMYYQDLDKSHIAMFTDLTIMCKKKEDMHSILMDRKIKFLRNNNSESAKKQFQKKYDCEVKKEAQEMSNSVRLYFEAFLKGNECVPLCDPLFSEPIHNQKSPENGDLKIHRISHCKGGCKGSDDIIILCRKVPKDKIKVLFYELDEMEGKIVWQDFGKFSPADVHYQVAIPFKSPPYKENVKVDKTVKVCLMRNDEYSEPVDFTYVADTDLFEPRKRKKLDLNESVLKENVVPSMVSPSSSSNGASADLFMDDVSMNNLGIVCSPSEDGSIWQQLLAVDHELSPDSSQQVPQSDQETAEINQNGDIREIMQMNEDELKSYLSQDEFDILEYLQIDSFKDTHNQPKLQIDAGVIPMTPLKSKLSPEIIMNQNFELCMLNPNEINDFHFEYVSDEDPLDDKNDGYSSVEGQMLCEIEQGMADVCIKDNVSQNYLNKNFSKESKNNQEVIKTENISRNKCIDSQICSRLLSFRDEMGNTLLHLAVLHNKSIEKLLKLTRGPGSSFVNLQNNNRKTAIHLATEKNNARFIWELLQNGADPNLKDSNGNHCLHIASLNNFFNCMEELLDNPKSFTGLNSVNYEGLTPLHLTLKNNSVNCFHLLMDLVDVNILEKKGGNSPLHFAVEMQPSLIGILLEQSTIKVNVQNFRGDSPLHVACSIGNSDVVQLLLQSGADPLLKNFNLYSEISEEENSEDETGAVSLAIDPDEISKNKQIEGQTPLDLATDSEILKMLKKAIQSEDNEELIDPSQMEELLCKLLDEQLHPEHLNSVLMYMGLDDCYKDSFQVCSSSPTKAIISYLKKNYGNSYMDPLVNFLEMAGLDDALKTVQQWQH